MSRLDDILKRLYEEKPYIGRLCFLDTETTGFAKDARIIEIGAIGVSYNGFDLDITTFESLINPGFPVSDKITEITGITNSELNKARGDEVYDDFLEWWLKLNPEKMIAHNASFDKGKLEYNLFRIGRPLTLPTVECTMKLSRQYLTKTANDKLGTLAEYFNFTNSNAHRALSDAEVCAFSYCKIMLGEYE